MVIPNSVAKPTIEPDERSPRASGQHAVECERAVHLDHKQISDIAERYIRRYTIITAAIKKLSRSSCCD
jgi:hypothetical protein